MKSKLLPVFVAVLALLLTTAVRPSPERSSAPSPSTLAEITQIEVFSPWVSGVDDEAYNAVLDAFRANHPDIEVLNPWGSFECPTCELQYRVASGSPPDSFWSHMGRALIDNWVIPGYLVPLDDVYAESGLETALPKQVSGYLYYDDHPWAVPLNIHRTNLIWYNKEIFDTYGIKASDLKTFAGWETAAKKLQAAGIVPLALGDVETWTNAQLFEDILAGTLSAQKYEGLWTGETDWNDPKVTQALVTFKMMRQYVNDDHAMMGWEQAAQLVIDGDAAMTIMGDWVNGKLLDEGFTGYGWMAAPGSEGIYVVVSDTFTLPQYSPHPEAAKEFLRFLASPQAQGIFNQTKGSICPRTDCSDGYYNDYQRSAAKDFKNDKIVPSIHGTAANDAWVSAYFEAIANFVNSGDVAAAQAELANACIAVGVCQ
jgi:glucose/mannose transport system substrate-binding protein